jgi:hypothetical protein
MKESVEQFPNLFKYPNIVNEQGEFERVGTEFGIDTSVLEYLAQNGELAELSEDVWQILENTDSLDISPGDYGKVDELSKQVGRDWETIHEALESGKTIEAPIVMKHEEKYHLVSGNTRLMVARAMGIRPTVLLFETE